MSNFESARTVSVNVTVATAGTNPAPAYRFATFTTGGNRVVALTGDGDLASGIIAENVDASQVGTFVVPMVVPDGSIALVEAGGTVTVGANVASDATGKAVVGATDDVILGKFVSAGASGAIVQIHFTGYSGVVG